MTYVFLKKNKAHIDKKIMLKVRTKFENTAKVMEKIEAPLLLIKNWKFLKSYF